jgi:hypothetical protein
MFIFGLFFSLKFHFVPANALQYFTTIMLQILQNRLILFLNSLLRTGIKSAFSLDTSINEVVSCTIVLYCS